MRKQTALFILLISIGLVFAGAAFAAPQVDIKVVDNNGTPVNKTSPGEEVNITGNASTDEYLYNPAVLITVDPKSGLKINDKEAVMIYDGSVFTNDGEYPFFYWDESYNAWVWWIGYVYGNQFPGELAQLFVPATVNDEGEITVNANYMEWDDELDEPVLVASDIYTFQSVEKAQAGTVPMQNTGAQIGLVVLGFLSIVGGSIYGKFR